MTSKDTANGPSWLDFAPADFDTDAPPVQLALVVAPDPCGTPDMFGGER
jgi:hypothetical protein